MHIRRPRNSVRPRVNGIDNAADPIHGDFLRGKPLELLSQEQNATRPASLGRDQIASQQYKVNFICGRRLKDIVRGSIGRFDQ
jgi:hypothetical protein